MLSVAWEGQKSEYMPQDPQTMRAKCHLSRGCFPWLAAGVTRCRCSHPWVDQLVCPPPVSILKGDTAMGCIHPPPGGRRSHCGTCPFHSRRPCQQLRFIYIHSCFFRRTELETGRRSLCVFMSMMEVVKCLVVVQKQHCDCIHDFREKCHNTGADSLKPAAARKSFNLTQALAEDYYYYYFLRAS